MMINMIRKLYTDIPSIHFHKSMQLSEKHLRRSTNETFKSGYELLLEEKFTGIVPIKLRRKRKAELKSFLED